MKVLYIVTAYPRYEGDVITPWLVETIRNLSERGIQITVFSPSYRGLKDHTIFGTPVRRFRYFFKPWEDLSHDETVPDRIARRIRYKFIALAYMLFGSLAIVRLCRSQRFDIIHVHWPFPHFWFGYLGRKFSGARVVSSFHGAELRWVTRKALLFRPFLRWAIRKSDVVTCNSSHTKREIENLYPRDVRLIPFGSSIRPSAAPQTERKLSKPYLLFVGRLVERKGIPILLKAFKELTKRWEGELVIVGDGPERESLIQQTGELGLNSLVKFTGFLSADELRLYYQNCSAFVLPAITDAKGDTEGLGVVLIEALSYKKPVVASAVGGITDVIIDGKTGLLVPEKNPTFLAETLLNVLRDNELSLRLGESGYKYCQEYFGWDRIITQLLNIYQTLSHK